MARRAWCVQLGQLLSCLPWGLGSVWSAAHIACQMVYQYARWEASHPALTCRFTCAVTKILDLPEGQEVAVIGTLYKEMKLKPSILDEYNKVLPLAISLSSVG